MSKTKSAFSEFTNLYEVSKTLRFELKPTNKTTQEIISGNTFEIDKKRQEKRTLLLNLIDELLGKYIDNLFIVKNLENISFNGYFEEYKNNKIRKVKKEKFEYIKENMLVKNITNLYSEVVYIEDINKNINFESLLKEEVLDYIKLYKKLNEENEQELSELEKEIIETLNIFNNKFTLIQDFIKSRKETIFSKQAKAGSLVYRIVKENLQRFIQNKEEFERIFDMFKNKQLDFIKDEFKFTDIDVLLEGENIFDLEFYKKCFIQNGIDKYNEKIGKLRSKLNNIVQEIKNKNKELKKSDKKETLVYQPKMNALKILDKQILGKKDKKNKEFEIKTVEDFFDKLNKLYEQNYSGEKSIISLENHIFSIFNTFKENDHEFDFKKIYINKRAIETLSGKFFNDFNLLGTILPGKEEKGKKKLSDFYTLEQLQKSFETFSKNKENLELDSSIIFKEKYFKDENILEQNSKDYFNNFIKCFISEFKSIFDSYKKEEENFRKLLKKLGNSDSLGDLQNEENILKIQTYSKITLDVYRMIAYFFPMKKTKEGMQYIKTKDEEDESFYEDLHIYFDENIIVNYFNLFRNFASRKPYSVDKVNVNFDTPTLLTGWQESNGSMQYKGVILKEKDKYFLGILKKGTTNFNLDKHKEEFDENLKEGDYYKFMNYKQSKWGNNIVNNYGSIFGNKFTDDIKNIGEQNVIENFKKILEKYLGNFPELNLLREKTYNSVEDLKNDFENLNLYKIEFLKIKKSYVDNLEDFYLFQIYSKDFSDSDKKDKNSKIDQQTNYFKGLFDEKNLKNILEKNGNSIFKLEGLSKLFFREKTKELPNRMKNKQEIEFLNIRRKDNNGNNLEDKIEKVKQNRRFAENKLLFHFTMKLNFGKNEFESVEKFNEKINNELIKTGKIKKIIGLDRGEKHLVYLSLIDENGKIELSKTLNLVGKDKDGNLVDYKQKLDDIEKERLGERKTWKQISTIKNLKEGYISQIVKEIVDLAIKENAVIVMEDLSLNFKNNRKGVEKQVYEKFEKALLKKLNYYVDKNGIYSDYRNGLQLTPKIDDLKETEIDKAKQLGIVLYVNPGYTSQTCPNCNFVRNIYLKYEGLTKSKNLLEKFEMNYKDGEFQFYEKEKKLTFYSGVERLKKDRKNTERKWETKAFNSTQSLEILLKKNFIQNERDIIKQIITKNSRWLYEELFGIINTILSIRNSETERETLEHIKEKGKNYIPKDFIHCPVCKYHSERRENITFGKIRNIEKLENADANGAYNIARKGIILLDKIKNDNVDLFVKSEDWDSFTQKQ